MHTVSIFDEIIEGMSIAIVSEFATRSRQLLQTLRSNGGEIPFEFRVFRQYHRAPRHKTVDQRLLTHVAQLYFQ